MERNREQVFLLTDGEVGNTKEVIEEVRRNSSAHRCFTFGIGEGASTALIKGVARVASGTYDFISGKDRLQPKVLKALKCALQPTVSDISLNWTLPPGVEEKLVSQMPTAIFQGQRSIIYVQLKGKLEEEQEAKVSLQYKFKNELLTNDLVFPLKMDSTERQTIHRLAAKNLISLLELDMDGEEVKKQILEASLQSGVISSLTAFVAVNKDTKTRVEGPPVTRRIPPVVLADPGAPVNRLVSFASQPIPISLGSASELGEEADAVPSVTTENPPVVETPTVETPPLYRLIALQKADGSWNATADVAAILGIAEDFADKRPDSNMEPSEWVTVLAVIWLHHNCQDHQEEWELLERKAVTWVKSKAGSSLAEAVQAGNALLKSSVDLNVFSL
ncbi:von Willebrand factor A domain-containing protein 5A-like [Hyperolius riggenbachi]|uniref:von Willebrand factor A domain-containing protein 5A-like n=1 Tax=Hyperolius riggenbachi TaxID=752182 RepID=UPI0035A3618A